MCRIAKTNNQKALNYWRKGNRLLKKRDKFSRLKYKVSNGKKTEYFTSLDAVCVFLGISRYYADKFMKSNESWYGYYIERYEENRNGTL